MDRSGRFDLRIKFFARKEVLARRGLFGDVVQVAEEPQRVELAGVVVELRAEAAQDAGRDAFVEIGVRAGVLHALSERGAKRRH